MPNIIGDKSNLLDFVLHLTLRICDVYIFTRRLSVLRHVCLLISKSVPKNKQVLDNSEISELIRNYFNIGILSGNIVPILHVSSSSDICIIKFCNKRFFFCIQILISIM